MKDKISYRVMQTYEFENQRSVFYRIMCDCCSPEDDMTIELEWDDGIITLFFYKRIYWKYYYYGWWQKLKKRIIAIFKLLFGGYIEMQGDFLLLEEQHINSFIEALEEGKKKVKERIESNP